MKIQNPNCETAVIIAFYIILNIIIFFIILFWFAVNCRYKYFMSVSFDNDYFLLHLMLFERGAGEVVKMWFYQRKNEWICERRISVIFQQWTDIFNIGNYDGSCTYIINCHSILSIYFSSKIDFARECFEITSFSTIIIPFIMFEHECLYCFK